MKWLVDTDVFFAALNTGHVRHEAARRWLDQAKSDGWGLSVETFLAAVRLLMNPQVMKGFPLRARAALRVVRAELSGRHSGEIVSGGPPQDSFLLRATGHKQVMDFYLIQTAMAHGAQLITFDEGTWTAWPEVARPVKPDF